jgi:hypothetical protein
MKLFDALTSTKRPPKKTPVLSEAELSNRLIVINRDTAPFQIADGSDENVHFIAEWKLRDPRWTQVFSDAGVEDTNRIYLRLVPEKHEVRASDRRYKVSWKPSFEAKIEKEMGQDAEAKLEVTLFEIEREKGQTYSFKFGTEWAYTEILESGEEHKYRFTPQELKSPIQEAVTECGWTYKGVAFGKL